MGSCRLAIAILAAVLVVGCGNTEAEIQRRVEATQTAKDLVAARAQQSAPVQQAAPPPPAQQQAPAAPPPQQSAPPPVQQSAPPPQQAQSVANCPAPIVPGDGVRYTQPVTVPPGCVGVVDAFEFNAQRSVITVLPSGSHQVNMLSGKIMFVPEANRCTAFNQAVRDFQTGAGSPPANQLKPAGC